MESEKESFGSKVADFLKAPLQGRTYALIFYFIFVNVSYSWFCFAFISGTFSASFSAVLALGTGLVLLFIFAYCWRGLLIGHLFLSRVFLPKTDMDPQWVELPSFFLEGESGKGVLEKMEHLLLDHVTVMAVFHLVFVNFFLSTVIWAVILTLFLIVVYPIGISIQYYTCPPCRDVPITGDIWTTLMVTPLSIISFFLMCNLAKFFGNLLRDITKTALTAYNQMELLESNEYTLKARPPHPILFEWIPEMYTSEIGEHIKNNKSFRQHVIFAGVVTGISFLTWSITDFWASVYPWCFTILLLFLLSLSYHYYIFVHNGGKWLQLHYAWFILVNTYYFLSWVFAFGLPTYNVPMFFLPITAASGLFLSLHDAHLRYHGAADRFVRYHLRVFFFANFFLFSIFLQSPEYPWFLFSFCWFALFLIIHLHHHYHPGNYFNLHFWIYLDIQACLFFAWGSTEFFVPWFIFPLLIWTVILIVHYRKHDPEAAKQKEEQLRAASLEDNQQKKGIFHL